MYKKKLLNFQLMFANVANEEMAYYLPLTYSQNK